MNNYIFSRDIASHRSAERIRHWNLKSVTSCWMLMHWVPDVVSALDCHSQLQTPTTITAISRNTLGSLNYYIHHIISAKESLQYSTHNFNKLENQPVFVYSLDYCRLFFIVIVTQKSRCGEFRIRGSEPHPAPGHHIQRLRLESPALQLRVGGHRDCKGPKTTKSAFLKTVKGQGKSRNCRGGAGDRGSLNTAMQCWPYTAC